MEWIEKIKKAISVAMDKKLYVSGCHDSCAENFQFYIGVVGDDNRIAILCFKESIYINTKKGFIRINYTFTDRDKLELQALCLSINEYRENMAKSEFDEFVYGNQEDTYKNIDELDDDE